MAGFNFRDFANLFTPRNADAAGRALARGFDEETRRRRSSQFDAFVKDRGLDSTEARAKHLTNLKAARDKHGKGTPERVLAARELRRAKEIQGHFSSGRISQMRDLYSSGAVDSIQAADRYVSHMERWGEPPRTKKSSEGSGRSFARQQAYMAAGHALTSSFGSVAGHVPVVGPAATHAVGTGLNALALGMGGPAALGLGAIVGAGSLIAGGINSSYNQYAQDENLLLQMGRMGGVGYGRRAIGYMRKQGFLNSEIAQSAIPLAQATGTFEGLDSVAKLQHAYGLGGNAVGLMGALARTGAQGDQSRAVKDAIAAGMVSGLQRGRFHEMVDGMRQIVQATTLGVTTTDESLAGVSRFAAGLGRSTNLRGSQLTGVVGGFDEAIKGHGGAYTQGLSFLTAFQHLNNRRDDLGVSVTDVMKLQERGLTGEGGMGAAGVSAMLNTIRGNSGVRDDDQAIFRGTKFGRIEDKKAAKERLQNFDQLIRQAIPGLSLNAAGSIRESFLDNKLDDKTLDKAMEDSKSKEDRAYDEIIEQTGIMRNIERNTEAIGRLSVFGNQDKWNKMVEGLSSKVANPERYSTVQERMGWMAEVTGEHGMVTNLGNKLLPNHPTTAQARARQQERARAIMPGAVDSDARFDGVLSGEDFNFRAGDTGAVRDYINALSGEIGEKQGFKGNDYMTAVLGAATSGITSGLGKSPLEAVRSVNLATEDAIKAREGSGEVLTNEDKEKFRRAVSFVADQLTGNANQFGSGTAIRGASIGEGVNQFLWMSARTGSFAQAQDASASPTHGPTSAANPLTP